MSTFSDSNASSQSILNSTNVTTSGVDLSDFFNFAFLSAAVVTLTQAVLIIVPNALVLVTILSSPVLRSRMRNKLVLSLSLANLIVGMFSCSFAADFYIRQEWVHGCYFEIVRIFLTYYIQNCVSSWGMVALLGHYLCQLKNYPGPEFFNKVPVWVGRVVPTLCVVFPWVLAFVGALPLAIVGLDRDMMKFWSDKRCLVTLQDWAGYTEGALVYFVPSFVSIVLVVAILIVYKCGRVRRHSDERELRKAEAGSCLVNAETLEKPAVHIAAGLLIVALMGPEHIIVKVPHDAYVSIKHFLVVMYVTSQLEELFPFIVGLLWLFLLGDIRARFVELLGMLPCGFCTRRVPPESSLSTFPPVVFSDIADD